MQNKLIAMFHSRKFWAAVAGLTYVVFGARADIDMPTLIAGVTVIVSYILGTALEDGMRAHLTKP